jgi:hypothetical protein
MTRAMDGHSWRDPGFPSSMHVYELSPAERQAAAKAEERRAQQMAEDYKQSVSARRAADAAAESSFDAVVDGASHILTPRQEELKRLQYVERPDGSIMHESLAKRRAAQRESEYNGGPTPEETAAFMREVEEEDDESFWNDE